MAVTATSTVRDIVTDAYLDIRVGQIGSQVDAGRAAFAVRHLNRIMKEWQLLDDAPDFLKASMTVTLTSSASYTMAPERPMRLLSVRLRRNGIDLPMQRMTRDDYDTMPDKATTGTPTQFYYDRQREDALLYVWPVLSPVGGETLQITYEREFDDVDINASIDLPVEWYNVAVRQLAARLGPAFGVDGMQGLADRALSIALGAGAGGEKVRWARG